MKKFLSTLAFVLAIGSVSMAKSSAKKSVVHHKNSAKTTKSFVKAEIYCGPDGDIIGMISQSGTVYGYPEQGVLCN